MTKFREFPEIDIPEFLDTEEFDDDSWHHNESPSVCHIITKNDLLLVVWVNGVSDFDVCVYDTTLGYNKFEKDCDSEKECLELVEEAILFIQNSPDKEEEVETEVEDYPLEAVGILTVNEFDIQNSFGEEERETLNIKKLTQEQLEEIAFLAQKKLFGFMNENFWTEFSDSVRDATMEVLELEYDDNFKLVKGE
jgi:hypothetical protein